MNKVLLILLGLMLLVSTSLAYVYLNTLNNGSVASNNLRTEPDLFPGESEPEPEKTPREKYTSFNGEPKEAFVGNGIVFDHPARWEANASGPESIEIVIPADGVYQQEIAFETGDFDELSQLADAPPELSATRSLSLYDREALSRVWSYPDRNRELYEYYIEGNSPSEVLKVTFEIDPDIFKEDTTYFNDLVSSITFIN